MNTQLTSFGSTVLFTDRDCVQEEFTVSHTLQQNGISERNDSNTDLMILVLRRKDRLLPVPTRRNLSSMKALLPRTDQLHFRLKTSKPKLKLLGRRERDEEISMNPAFYA